MRCGRKIDILALCPIPNSPDISWANLECNMSKSSASNLLKNFCYVEYLYVAAFLSNILCTIFQSMCANLICVQIWLQIAPDQWPRRGHSSRSPAAFELQSLERDKVLTSCITILMSDQTLPRGPKWVKREVFNFRRTVAHSFLKPITQRCATWIAWDPVHIDKTRVWSGCDGTQP